VLAVEERVLVPVLVPPAVGVPPLLLSTPPDPSGTLGLGLPEAD